MKKNYALVVLKSCKKLDGGVWFTSALTTFEKREDAELIANGIHKKFLENEDCLLVLEYDASPQIKELSSEDEFLLEGVEE